MVSATNLGLSVPANGHVDLVTNGANGRVTERFVKTWRISRGNRRKFDAEAGECGIDKCRSTYQFCSHSHFISP